MASERKQIEATLRNKLAKQYNQDREYQRERYSKLWIDYVAKCDEADKYRRKNLELEEKIEQYEDWIRRLQEFMDMPDGTREKAIQTYIAEQKRKEMFDAEMDLFSHLFSFIR